MALAKWGAKVQYYYERSNILNVKISILAKNFLFFVLVFCNFCSIFAPKSN